MKSTKLPFKKQHTQPWYFYLIDMYADSGLGAEGIWLLFEYLDWAKMDRR